MPATMGGVKLPSPTGKFLRDDGTWATPAGSSSASQLAVNLVADSANVAWTNMPLAATLFAGSHRHIARVDLSDYSECRLVVNKQATAGAANSTIELLYALSFQTTPAGYASIGETPAAVAVNTVNNVLSSAWVSLAAGAKGDVFLALVGSGGDGVIDPSFGAISAQFR